MMKILIITGCVTALLTVVVLFLVFIDELKNIKKENNHHITDLDKLSDELLKETIKEEELKNES